jgi:hypothetical protein
MEADPMKIDTKAKYNTEAMETYKGGEGSWLKALKK